MISWLHWDHTKLRFYTIFIFSMFWKIQSYCDGMIKFFFFGKKKDHNMRFVNLVRGRRTNSRVIHNDIHFTIDSWIFTLWISRFDKLIKTCEEAQSSQPPHDSLSLGNVLTIKVQCQLWSYTIVPHRIMILYKLHTSTPNQYSIVITNKYTRITIMWYPWDQTNFQKTKRKWSSIVLHK